jgi:hypothetical protein
MTRRISNKPVLAGATTKPLPEMVGAFSFLPEQTCTDAVMAHQIEFGSRRIMDGQAVIGYPANAQPMSVTYYTEIKLRQK